MKIQYDLKKNYFKYFNEAEGIFIRRNSLKNNKKVITYMEYFLIDIVLTIIIYIMNIYLFLKINNFIYNILEFLSFMIFFLSIFCIINFICLYIKSQRSLHKGYIKIDKFGITDYSDDNINIGFGWDKIEKIIVGKNTITIIQNSNFPIMIFINIEHLDEVEEAIDRYNSNIDIVYLKR